MLWYFPEWSIYIIIIVIISLFLNNFSGRGDLLANVCKIFFQKLRRQVSRIVDKIHLDYKKREKKQPTFGGATTDFPGK